MINLIKLLIFGHIHKWETINSCTLHSDFGARGTRHTLRCVKCGDIVKRDLI
jgi:hypothetical protein